MFKAARIQKIKEIIANRTQIDVQTLSDILEVSNVTIRNDLEQLEKEGFIYRTHGGAILRESNPAVPVSGVGYGSSLSFDFSMEVLHIANLAAEYIGENEWIFLGGGCTCCAIAKALISRPVNLVTNNILAALVLSENPKANVMLTGGVTYNDKFPFLSGDLAINNINGLYFQKTFFGASGIDLKYGYSVPSPVEYNLFQSLRERSKELIIVADASKCDKSAFLSLGALDSVDTLISSSDLPDEYKAYYYEKNIKLFLDYDISPAQVSGGEF